MHLFICSFTQQVVLSVHFVIRIEQSRQLLVFVIEMFSSLTFDRGSDALQLALEHPCGQEVEGAEIRIISWATLIKVGADKWQRASQGREMGIMSDWESQKLASPTSTKLRCCTWSINSICLNVSPQQLGSYSGGHHYLLFWLQDDGWKGRISLCWSTAIFVNARLNIQ